MEGVRSGEVQRGPQRSVYRDALGGALCLTVPILGTTVGWLLWSNAGDQSQALMYQAGVVGSIVAGAFTVPYYFSRRVRHCSLQEARLRGAAGSAACWDYGEESTAKLVQPYADRVLLRALLAAFLLCVAVTVGHFLADTSWWLYATAVTPFVVAGILIARRHSQVISSPMLRR